MNISGNRVTLRAAFSEQPALVAANFEHQLLLACMAPWKRPLASLILQLWPRALKPDLEVMRDAADAWNLEQVRVLVVELKKPRSGWSMVRDGLSIRASGRRLVQLAASRLGGGPIRGL